MAPMWNVKSGNELSQKNNFNNIFVDGEFNGK